MIFKRKLRLKHQVSMLFFVVMLMSLGSVAANGQHYGRNAQVRRDVHHRRDHNRRVVRAPVYYGNSGYYGNGGNYGNGVYYGNGGYYGNDGYYGNTQPYPPRRPTYYPPQRRSGIGSVLRVILGGGRSHQRRGH